MGPALVDLDPHQCTICLIRTSAMHWHHTVPRSRGGEDSLQIPLCGDCHTVLHSHALAMASAIRRGKRIKNPTRWLKPEDEERAKPFLEVLVRSLLMPIPEGFDRTHLVQTSVPTATYEALHALKLDQGLGSLERTLVYCIERSIDLGSSHVHQTKTGLWFLPIS